MLITHRDQVIGPTQTTTWIAQGSDLDLQSTKNIVLVRETPHQDETEPSIPPNISTWTLDTNVREN